jgi:mycothiol synthase
MANDLTAQGLIVRAPTVDDVEGVCALYDACSMDEVGAPAHHTVADLRQWWSRAAFNLRSDAFAVQTPAGAIVAYGEEWSPPPHATVYADGCVHPRHTGRGIGTHLLRLLEERACAIASLAAAEAGATIATEIIGTNGAARRLLEGRGYTLVRHSWHMALELDAEPSLPRWPEGIAVRTAVPGQDERAIWEAGEEAFLDHYDHHPWPFEEWLKLMSTPDHYDTSLWFLGMDGDQVAGLALCRASVPDYPECGWVGTLGVRRPWRRRGLGLALLQHTFAEFYRRGRRRVGLGVDASSLTGATRLYERAGMRVVRQRDRYEKALRPGEEVHTADAR